MFSLIILVLYLIVVAIFTLISFFIVYHLVKYSVDSQFKIIMLIFFVVISTGLLFSNLALFFSTDWNVIVLNISLK